MLDRKLGRAQVLCTVLAIVCYLGGKIAMFVGYAGGSVFGWASVLLPTTVMSNYWIFSSAYLRDGYNYIAADAAFYAMYALALTLAAVLFAVVAYVLHAQRSDS